MRAQISNEALDRYEILAPIGSGGFASVFLARHRLTGREVALKVSDPAGDPELVARSLNEARVTASIRHPSLVEVFDCGALPDGRIFVAMERIDGITLEAVLEREGGTLVPGRAVWLARQALSALEAVHAHGVVHRDIKPANLIVRWDARGEQLYVIDFGISKVVSWQAAMAQPGTMLGAVLGTPGYMAPEQLDARNVDARADVYGIAAVLYRAISGRKPYEAKTLEAWIAAVTESAPPPLAQVAPWTPPALAHVIDRALARDRDARPGSATALREALEATLTLDAALSGGGQTLARTVATHVTPQPHQSVPVASPPTQSARTQAPTRRTLLAVSAALTIAALVVGAAVIYTQLAPSSQEATTSTKPAGALIAAGPPAKPAVAEEEDPFDAIEREALEPLGLAAPAAPHQASATATPAAAPSPGAATASPAEPPRPRRVRFVYAQPVGEIDMAEIRSIMNRALSDIGHCYEGTEPRRIELLFIFTTTGAPMISPLGDQTDVGRCAAMAVVTSAGRSTRSSGILRDVVFAWE